MRWTCAPLACLIAAPVSLAQVLLPPGVGTDAYGNYTSAHTGGIYNNPTSAFLAGEIQKNAMNNMIMNNMISNMIVAEFVKEEIRKEEGRKRIAAGKASTMFVASNDGITIDSRVAQGASPESAEKTRAAARSSLDEFNQQMKARGYDTRDVADAKALAFCMAFAAFKGEDPGPARMESLRAKFRGEMLASELWQGYAEHERQAEYENVAIPAMMAITARAASAAKDVPDDQQGGFERAAKELAEPVLKQFIRFPIESLELTADGVGDRGERLAKGGLGTATFHRVQPFITVRDYSMRWDFLKKPAGYWEQAIARFDAVVQASGGAVNDVADANAAAFAIYYYVQSEGMVELSRAQVEWVRAEMRKDVLGSVEYQRMSDLQRQRLYEDFALESVRIRDDYHEQERVLALPKPEDPFAAMAHASNQGFARDWRQRDIATALAKCKDIFQPRKLEEFVLVDRGFAAIGTGDPIAMQTPPPDAPALAAFSADGVAPIPPAPAATSPQPNNNPASPIPPTTPPTPTSSTGFIRVPECLTVAEFVGKHAEITDTPADVAELLSDFDMEVEEDEGRMTDLGDAKATAFAMIYELLNDEELSEAQVTGARAYFRDQVQASTEMQGWNDRRRQQAYERIGLRATILLRRVDLEDDQAKLDKIADAAHDYLDLLLAPASMQTVRVTPRGIEPR